MGLEFQRVCFVCAGRLQILTDIIWQTVKKKKVDTSLWFAHKSVSVDTAGWLWNAISNTKIPHEKELYERHKNFR